MAKLRLNDENEEKEYVDRE